MFHPGVLLPPLENHQDSRSCNKKLEECKLHLQMFILRQQSTEDIPSGRHRFLCYLYAILYILILLSHYKLDVSTICRSYMPF